MKQEKQRKRMREKGNQKPYKTTTRNPKKIT
jgi:hypothetical protein